MSSTSNVISDSFWHLWAWSLHIWLLDSQVKLWSNQHIFCDLDYYLDISFKSVSKVSVWSMSSSIKSASEIQNKFISDSTLNSYENYACRALFQMNKKLHLTISVTQEKMKKICQKKYWFCHCVTLTVFRICKCFLKEKNWHSTLILSLQSCYSIEKRISILICTFIWHKL